MPDKFTSEGFDLDAIPSEEKGGDTIYEIGGGASTTAPLNNNAAASTDKKSVTNDGSDNPLLEAEALKAKGNERFKAGDHMGAYDLYSDAIAAIPPGGLTGEKILEMRDEYEEAEREKRYAQHRRESEKRITKKDDTKDKDNDEEEEDEETKDDEPLRPFQIPSQPHGSQMAMYYSNRAAALLHLHRYEEAISDCDVAILLNPLYVKALIRRMTAHEAIDKTEEALQDARAALVIEPHNREVRKHVQRLTKVEEERMERLKQETFGKLKDLGNSILGNFGLSLDNFKAEKDPNTGSYSISFQQNGGK